MNKLNLNNVTLACIDDVDPVMAKMIMQSLSARIDFAETMLFSSKSEDCVNHKINSIGSLKDYSVFAVKEMHKYINSDFLMIIQRDGYPINLDAWDNEFLDYDYIGEPWNWIPQNNRAGICPVGKCVGNGGFSIRSKKLMVIASEYDYDGSQGDEDEYLCRVISDELKSRGVKFAPTELASYFSIENFPYNNQFGFHGPYTLELNKKMGIFKFKDHAYEHDYKD